MLSLSINLVSPPVTGTPGVGSVVPVLCRAAVSAVGQIPALAPRDWSSPSPSRTQCSCPHPTLPAPAVQPRPAPTSRPSPRVTGHLSGRLGIVDGVLCRIDSNGHPSFPFTSPHHLWDFFGVKCGHSSPISWSISSGLPDLPVPPAAGLAVDRDSEAIEEAALLPPGHGAAGLVRGSEGLVQARSGRFHCFFCGVFGSGREAFLFRVWMAPPL